MKLPRQFYQPLAIGAPAPLRELPVRLERMIHFVPPHVEKVTAKVPELAAAGRRRARQSRRRDPGRRQGGGARGLHRHGQGASTSAPPACGRGSTRSTRPGRSTTSREIVGRDRQQARRHHAAEGRGRLGHPLPRPAAGAARSQARRSKKPILIHAILETAQGVNNVEAIAQRLAAHARHESRARRSRRLARHEDHARRRRPSRLRRCWPMPRTARRATNSSRTSGTTPSPRWSMPAPPPASSRSTARSAISPIPMAARRSSATPS